jgi:DNA-binding transcriptional ArsR family regulator
VQIFDVLGDPVRRRLVEHLAAGETTAGALVTAIRKEFGITQPAVSRQLRLLREAGVVTVRPQGALRWYRVAPAALQAVDEWLVPFRSFWDQRLDALETELVRDRRRRSSGSRASVGAPSVADVEATA